MTVAVVAVRLLLVFAQAQTVGQVVEVLDKPRQVRQAVQLLAGKVITAVLTQPHLPLARAVEEVPVQ
jgi:hypothetical protein